MYNSKIVVTKHARERLKERFSAKFHRYVGIAQMLDNLIIGQVSTGTILNDWKKVPFYKNKMDSSYGPGTEIVRKSGVYYVCMFDLLKNIVTVCTAVKSILYYPSFGSIVITTSGGARHVNEKEYIVRLHEEALKEKSRRALHENTKMEPLSPLPRQRVKKF